MTILFAIIAVFVLCFILYKASEVFIHSIKALSDDGFLSKFFLASIFGGIATSIPEIFIGIASSLEKKPEIAIGNALGSNIADLSLVLPLAVLLLNQAININKEEISLKNAFLLLSSSFLPFLLAIDGSLSRVDGLFLIGMFFIYTFYIFQKRPSGIFGLFSFLKKISHEFHRKLIGKEFLSLLISLFTLIFTSDLLVRTTLFLSQALQIKIFLLSLFLIAVGTSLPELFVALQALRKHENAILFGDIFGSLVTNANLVVGLAGFIHPINFASLSTYTLSIIILFLSFILFTLFSFTKRKLEVWEAIVLLSLYVIFFILEGTV